MKHIIWAIIYGPHKKKTQESALHDGFLSFFISIMVPEIAQNSTNTM